MKPIIFCTPMVQAILEGRKTQTRRVIKPQPDAGLMPNKYAAPYKPGDILWVRETWKPDYHDEDGYCYKADGDREMYPNNLLHWRPSIHMPRAAARIFLRVTDVRAERVQDISAEDAHSEGIACIHDEISECAAFAALWDEINAKRDGGRYAWERNPWVWAYTFERIAKEEAERA